jgi:hypothetical protein
MYALIPWNELLTGVVTGDFSLLGESAKQNKRKEKGYHCEYLLTVLLFDPLSGVQFLCQFQTTFWVNQEH